MTNPLDRIRRLVRETAPKVGKVILIEGGLATVSTTNGPVRANVAGNTVRVGDKVQISGETVVGRLRSESDAPVYRI